MQYLIIDNEVIPKSIGFTPTLALAFYRYDQKDSFKGLASELSHRFKDLQIIGSSSSSNIAEDIPFETEKSIIILLDLEKTAFSVEYFSSDMPIDTNIETVQHQTKLLFYSRYDNRIEQHLHALQNSHPLDHLFGTVAGADISDEQKCSSIYYKGRFCNQGVVMLSLDPAYYQLKGNAFHDFEPIGMELTVTGCKDNVITYIEDEPALELIESMVGKLTTKGIETFEYPLMISDKQDKQSDYTPLASLRSINREENTLSLFRNIEQGSKIKIGLSASRKEIRHRIDKLCQNIKVTQQSLTFLFSCSAFQKHWGNNETLYIMGIQRCSKGAVVGFHTFGEIAPIHANTRSTLQNQTLTAVTLFETGGK